MICLLCLINNSAWQLALEQARFLYSRQNTARNPQQLPVYLQDVISNSMFGSMCMMFFMLVYN